VWFKHLFRLMSGVTCSSDNRMTCLDWSSGSGSHEIDKGATLVQVRRLYARTVITSHCVYTRHREWNKAKASTLPVRKHVC
jgi:hypothetical protein